MDSTVCRLCSSTADLEPSFSSLDQRFENGFDDVNAEARLAVCRMKDILEKFPESCYRDARDRVFPQRTLRVFRTSFSNRAGFKLLEVMEVAQLWAALPSKGLRFVDLCGGPGAFSQVLLEQGEKEHKARGIGFTLRTPLHEGVEDCGWYSSLRDHPRFTAVFGVDGTGNICHRPNIESLASLVAFEPSGNATPHLVVADGGFETPTHQFNLQELLMTRIVFAEWYAGIRILRLGGVLVVKLFDTFSPFVRSLLFLTCYFFESAIIIKPSHSRAVNSERYLVGRQFKGMDGAWQHYLTRVMECDWSSDASTRGGPYALVPDDIVFADEMFLSSYNTMVNSLATAQIEAIQKVVNELTKDVEA